MMVLAESVAFALALVAHFALCSARWHNGQWIADNNGNKQSRWLAARSVSNALGLNANDTVPSYDGALAMGDFGGLLPVDYALRLRLPVADRKGNRLTVRGAATVRLRVVRPTRVIYLHGRQLDVDSRLVGVTDESSGVPVPIVTLRYLPAPDELLAIEVDAVLMRNRLYTVHFGSVVGSIAGPFQMGLFQGLAVRRPTGSAYVYASQLQTNYGRTVFPCVDHPAFKARFRLAIEHPPDYTAYSSAPALPNGRTVLSDGWHEAQFDWTPQLPVYTFGLTIVPSFYTTARRTTPDGTLLRVHYNPYNFAASLARDLLTYAAYSYNAMFRAFAYKLPTGKIDFVVIPQFKVQGMENWALITLNEAYVSSSAAAFRLSLVAHEMAHMWISNVATVRDWRHVCLQEAITDHYARRVVKSFFGEQSSNYQSYIWDKYVVSTRLASSQSPPRNLLVSASPQLSEVSQNCFGAAVFVIDSLRTVMGGNLKFDRAVAKLVATRAHGNFDLADVAILWDKYRLGGGVSAGTYLVKWMSNEGFPTVTLRRNYTDGSLLVSQAGLYAKSNGLGRTSNLWPTPVKVLERNGRTLTISRLLTGEQMATAPLGVSSHNWILANPGFEHFYRVNYDANNWSLLIDALHTNATKALPNLLDRIRVASDFCYLSTIGAVDRTTASALSRILLEAMQRQAAAFPGRHLYSSVCGPRF